jgi:hypothetical protein
LHTFLASIQRFLRQTLCDAKPSDFFAISIRTQVVYTSPVLRDGGKVQFFDLEVISKTLVTFGEVSALAKRFQTDNVRTEGKENAVHPPSSEAKVAASSAF